MKYLILVLFLPTLLSAQKVHQYRLADGKVYMLFDRLAAEKAMDCLDRLPTLQKRSVSLDKIEGFVDRFEKSVYQDLQNQLKINENLSNQNKVLTKANANLQIQKKDVDLKLEFANSENKRLKRKVTWRTISGVSIGIGVGVVAGAILIK